MANIAELKDNLSSLLDAVERGEEVVISRRNVPFARIVALPTKRNRTRLGSQREMVEITGPITGPVLPESDWHMLDSGTASQEP